MLLGVVAFTLVLHITDPPGPGLDPDALAYMGSAESFARMGEFRAPTARWWSSDSTAALAHFPPGFATALAAPVRLGMDPMQGARLVQALCAFVIVTTLVPARERGGGAGRRRVPRHGAVLDGLDARSARVRVERAALPGAARARAVRHGASSRPTVAGRPRRRPRDAHPLRGHLHRRRGGALERRAPRHAGRTAAQRRAGASADARAAGTVAGVHQTARRRGSDPRALALRQPRLRARAGRDDARLVARPQPRRMEREAAVSARRGARGGVRHRADRGGRCVARASCTYARWDRVVRPGAEMVFGCSPRQGS